MLYVLKIKNYINISNIDVFKLYNIIADNILKLDIKGFEDGIWNIIDNLPFDPLNIKKTGYKTEYSISHLIYPFRNNNIFSFEVKKQYNLF